MKNRIFFKWLMLLFITLGFSSCSAFIEHTAANSIAAAFASFGEYFIACITVLAIIFLHLARVLAFPVIYLGVMGVKGVVSLSISPSFVISIGVLMLLLGFVLKIKQYSPKVIIGKDVTKAAIKEASDKKNKKGYIIQYVCDFFIGIVLIIIEHIVFN